MCAFVFIILPGYLEWWDIKTFFSCCSSCSSSLLGSFFFLAGRGSPCTPGLLTSSAHLSNINSNHCQHKSLVCECVVSFLVVTGQALGPVSCSAACAFWRRCWIFVFSFCRLLPLIIFFSNTLPFVSSLVSSFNPRYCHLLQPSPVMVWLLKCFSPSL